MNGFTLAFYRRSGSLRSPVEAYLTTLIPEERGHLLEAIYELAAYHPDYTSRYTKHIFKKIRELRFEFHNRQHRIFYIIRGHFIVLLHAFLKKTQKTPRWEVDLALRNLSDYLTQ